MSAVAVEQDGWAQRGGIDRLLTLACGRTYTVDEKIRTEDWPDVLLERWSNEGLRRPGWVQKPLAAICPRVGCDLRVAPRAGVTAGLAPAWATVDRCLRAAASAEPGLYH